jgi:crotonobetainyl-CoA:carnitine CoA-transferase CaiB-like acyl-CoA transferase
MGYQYSGKLAGRQSQASAVGSGVHPCADGYFLITGGARFIPNIIRMIGMEELLDQEEWSTPEGRAHPDRIDEFLPYLIPWTIARTKDEIRIEAEKHAVLGGPM